VDGSTKVVYHVSRNLLTNVRSPFSVDVARAPGTAEETRVRIRFLAPTILKSDGQIVEQPMFGDLMRRLRDRVNALASFHGDGALEVDFRGLPARAADVRTVALDVRWESRSRVSSKRRVQHDLSGVVGSMEYAGTLEEFIPWLRLAELVHVGKNATFGNGWIDVERIAVTDRAIQTTATTIG